MDRLEGRNRLYNDNGWRIDHILGHKANLENINGTQLNGIYILKFFFPRDLSVYEHSASFLVCFAALAGWAIWNCLRTHCGEADLNIFETPTKLDHCAITPLLE